MSLAQTWRDAKDDPESGQLWTRYFGRQPYDTPVREVSLWVIPHQIGLGVDRFVDDSIQKDGLIAWSVRIGPFVLSYSITKEAERG